jgi:hypothetical protein
MGRNNNTRLKHLRNRAKEALSNESRGRVLQDYFAVEFKDGGRDLHHNIAILFERLHHVEAVQFLNDAIIRRYQSRGNIIKKGLGGTDIKAARYESQKHAPKPHIQLIEEPLQRFHLTVNLGGLLVDGDYQGEPFPHFPGEPEPSVQITAKTAAIDTSNSVLDKPAEIKNTTTATRKEQLQPEGRISAMKIRPNASIQTPAEDKIKSITTGNEQSVLDQRILDVKAIIRELENEDKRIRSVLDLKEKEILESTKEIKRHQRLSDDREEAMKMLALTAEKLRRENKSLKADLASQGGKRVEAEEERDEKEKIIIAKSEESEDLRLKTAALEENYNALWHKYEFLSNEKTNLQEQHEQCLDTEKELNASIDLLESHIVLLDTSLLFNGKKIEDGARNHASQINQLTAVNNQKIRHYEEKHNAELRTILKEQEGSRAEIGRLREQLVYAKSDTERIELGNKQLQIRFHGAKPVNSNRVHDLEKLDAELPLGDTSFSGVPRKRKFIQYQGDESTGAAVASKEQRCRIVRT